MMIAFMRHRDIQKIHMVAFTKSQWHIVIPIKRSDTQHILSLCLVSQ